MLPESPVTYLSMKHMSPRLTGAPFLRRGALPGLLRDPGVLCPCVRYPDWQFFRAMASFFSLRMFEGTHVAGGKIERWTRCADVTNRPSGTGDDGNLIVQHQGTSASMTFPRV